MVWIVWIWTVFWHETGIRNLLQRQKSAISAFEKTSFQQTHALNNRRSCYYFLFFLLACVFFFVFVMLMLCFPSVTVPYFCRVKFVMDIFELLDLRFSICFFLLFYSFVHSFFLSFVFRFTLNTHTVANQKRKNEKRIKTTEVQVHQHFSVGFFCASLYI